jgi:hypothetical protein
MRVKDQPRSRRDFTGRFQTGKLLRSKEECCCMSCETSNRQHISDPGHRPLRSRTLHRRDHTSNPVERNNRS